MRKGVIGGNCFFWKLSCEKKLNSQTGMHHAGLPDSYNYTHKQDLSRTMIHAQKTITFLSIWNKIYDSWIVKNNIITY